jgi:hypothetical protein
MGSESEEIFIFYDRSPGVAKSVTLVFIVNISQKEDTLWKISSRSGLNAML